MLLDGRGFGSAFERVGFAYHLAGGVQAYLFRRTRPVTFAEMENLLDELVSAYPDWREKYRASMEIPFAARISVLGDVWGVVSVSDHNTLFLQHQPLNRQSERYAREGVDLSLSTLADQVGACAAALKPLHALIEAHVLGADRLHGDDTTVPILAKGKTDTGRIWTYVRDDRPFGGSSPPAALYYASRDRRQEHPERHLKSFTGILQADAYGGYNPLFKVDRSSGPLTQALCWAHSRRKFFVLADIAANAKRGKNATPISPVALEAVKRIDALFDIERDINGLSANERLQRRQQESRPLVDELEAWMRTERAKLSRSSPVAEPIDYMLKRWDGFTHIPQRRSDLPDQQCRRTALRGFALGRKSWLFAGSDRGADRAAFMATLIMTAKLNDIDPQAWLADVLARIADTPVTKLAELLSWQWRPETAIIASAA